MRWIPDALSMIRDINAESPWIGRWGAALNIPMFIGGPIFFAHPTAIAIFAANAIAVLIAAQIHKRRKFSRLTSICHLAWLPVIPQIANDLATADRAGPYFWWLAYVAATGAISLVLDVWNLWRFFGRTDKTFVDLPAVIE